MSIDGERAMFTSRIGVLFCILLALLLPGVAIAYNKSWDQGHNWIEVDGGWGYYDYDGVWQSEDSPKTCKVGTMCPVYANTGRLEETFTDLSLSGIGPTLAITRTYHSQQWATSFLGNGWTFNFGKRLITARRKDGEKILGLILETGEKNYYKEHSDGTLERLTGYGATFDLIRNVDGSYSIQELDGGRTELDADGKIEEIVDRNGNTLSFQYNAVGCVSRITNASGNYIDFVLGPNGKIASATDNSGRTIGYQYDENGNLTRVTDPLGNSVQYAYNSDNLLTQRTDPRGNVVETIGYDNHQPPRVSTFTEKGEAFTISYYTDRTEKTDSQGNTWTYYYNDVGVIERTIDPLGNETRQSLNKVTVASVDWEEDANGNRTTYTYDALGNVTSRTDALGNTWTYTYVAGTDWLATETSPLGVVTKYEYDSDGNQTKLIRDFGGSLENTTAYTYDGQGNQISVTDPLGNTTTYEYDAQGNMTKVTDALGYITTYAYDARGNRLTETDANGNTTTFAYDLLDRLVTVTDAKGNATSFQYDANGNLIAETDAEGHSRTQSYDSYDRLTQLTDPLGNATNYGYDWRDNRVSKRDANGNTTTYTYDAANHLTQETRPGSAVHSFEYDKVGNQLASIDPAGVRIDQTYDAANRLTARQDSSGDQEIYAYDALGNRTRVERRDAADQVTFGEDTQYDALSRPVQITTALGQVTTFAYDANGNLISITDPLGRVTTQGFDALNRATQIIDAASGVSGLDYDAVGNVTGVTDPRSLTTTYGYDALDRQTALDSPDTGLAQSTYDGNGNLIGRTDSRGIAVAHTYDALDRRTSTQYPDQAEDRALRYDEGTNGRGRLTGYDDESGSVDFSYDPRANLIGESRTIQAQVYNLGYGYDGADRLTRIDYPSGLQVTYAYDGQGRVSTITSNAGGILNGITYLPFGPLAGWSDGSGAQRTLTYDANYRLTGISVPGLLEWHYTHDGAGNITALIDDLDAGRNQTFIYDELNRLTDAAGAYGNYEFTLDPVGNRLTEDDDGLLTQYTYGDDNNRLLSAIGADSDSFTYDAVGNQIADARFASIYNQANRLAEVRQGAVTVAQYLYNAEGQRVVKTIGATVTHFLFGQQGQLLGVYDGSDGSAIEEIVYLGMTPVATVRDGQIYFIHTDHLGTPRVVTNGSQQIVWGWASDPFGEAIADQDPDGDGVAFVFGLRFAGQWFDGETGLHYNYSRDFDPTIGRYIQSDTIGLEGGLNTYLYADGNPLLLSDALGTNPTIIRIGLRAALKAARAAKKAIEKAYGVCKKIRCKIELHGPHHRFGWPFNRRMCHVQLTCWIKGKKGSTFIQRFPYNCDNKGKGPKKPKRKESKPTKPVPKGSPSAPNSQLPTMPTTPVLPIPPLMPASPLIPGL
ncbi:RHS repeat-associated core domain-containing protein [Thioflavicoccus mobilis]|nr:RHS repeat-associated core domain-containing protein [Thioflavicoccus mobilis]